METRIVIFEDDRFERFWPITATRPLWELRVGMLRIFEKWEISLRKPLAFYSPRQYILASFLRRTRNAQQTPRGIEALWIHAALLPPETSEIELLLDSFSKGDRLVDREGRLMIGYLDYEEFLQAYQEGGGGYQVPDAFRVLYHWGDVFRHHREQFFFDDMRLEFPREIGGEFSHAPHVLGDALSVGYGCNIGAYVTLDTRNGPIILQENVTVEPFSVLEGPVFVGAHSTIRAHSFLRDTAVGPVSKVGGEIQSSIVQGYSNKQHHGFLGHSYVGAWVNIGAGATTSNLKNTYGNVRLELPSGPVDTGIPFLGSLIGDHVKIGIQSTLTTGTAIGVGTIYARTVFSPKQIPSFVLVQENNTEVFRLEKALEVAQRMMARRNVSLTPEEKHVLRHVFEKEAALRQGFLEEMR